MKKTLHLQVRGVNTLLNGVSVSIEGGDNSVDVVFDVVEEKTVPITVTTNYLTIADGYILYDTELSKETVTLSGPSTEIDKVETCTAEVTHKGELTDSVTLDTALRFYTKSGSEVKFEYTNLEESAWRSRWKSTRWPPCLCRSTLSTRPGILIPRCWSTPEQADPECRRAREPDRKALHPVCRHHRSFHLCAEQGV